jgi:hypothetical protein
MMSHLLNVYEAKARELVSLFRSGDVSRDEFNNLKQYLLDLDNIEQRLDQDDLTITAIQINEAVTAILSVIE